MLEGIPRFSRGEYWILESMVDIRYPLRHLALSANEIEEIFNKPSHGMGPDDLKDTLESLFQQGLIKVFLSEVEIGTRLSRAQIVAALGETQRKTWCGLTDQGGAQWEAFAMPDWAAYVHFGSERELAPGSPWEVGTVVSATRDVVEQYLDALPHLGYTIQMSSLQWSPTGPWYPTYWKCLAVGHQARFRFEGPDECAAGFEDLKRALHIVYDHERRWYRWN